MNIDTILFLIDLLTKEQILFPTSYEYTFPLQDTDKCDIIELAEEELKNIDTTEIDHQFEQAIKKEQTIKLITQIKHNIKTDLQKYNKKQINDPDILDLRKSNKKLYIKTTKPIIQTTLANILAINENMIEPIPIKGKYNWYLIDCEKWGGTHIRRH